MKIRKKLPVAPSRPAQRMSHVVFTCPWATLASREMTRTMAKIMVMMPTLKTMPTENLWAVVILRVYKMRMGTNMTLNGDISLVLGKYSASSS